MKVGLLLPSSTYMPSVGSDIARCVEVGLATHADDSSAVVIETTRFNASEHEVAPKMQDLLVKHRVDIVVAPLNAALVEPMGRLAAAARTPLVVNTLGEDLVGGDSRPGVFINSFDLWRSAWMCGNWLVRAHGKSAATVAAMHDGGYGMVFAFGLGVEAAGGRVVSSGVTHRSSATEDPLSILESVVALEPDHIMGFYSGDEAASFQDAWNRLGSTAIPLGWLPDLGEHRAGAPPSVPAGMRSVGGWARDPSDPLQARLETETGNAINAYAVLAYETGALIADAIRQRDSGSSTDLVECLLRAEATGPRGTIRFDPETCETTHRHNLYDVRVGPVGFTHRFIERLEAPALLDEQVALARKNLMKTGWTNPYLIA